MPNLISPERKGEIKGFFTCCNNVSQTAKHFKCSPNTVRAILHPDKNGRRTDMDRVRKPYRDKKKKAKVERNKQARCLAKLARAEEHRVYYTGKKRKAHVRRLPKYPTRRAIQRKLIVDEIQKANAKNKRLRQKKKKATAEPKDVVSLSTIGRRLKSAGLRSIVRPKVPFAQENIQRRKNFVKNHPEFKNVAYISTMLFSDEHFVTSNDETSRTMWVTKGKRHLAIPRERKSKHNAVCSQFWAMIGHNYKSPLIWVDFKNKDGTRRKRLNADFYQRKILSNPQVLAKLKDKKCVFVQDGASSHNAKTTKAWLKRRGIKFIEDWPSHSPDMNPIEEVWALVNSMIDAIPENEAELRKTVEEKWAQIPLATINKYVGSFKGKAERVYARNGGSAKK